MNKTLCAVLLAVPSLAAAAAPAALTDIGVAAAVRGAVHAVAPGQAAGRIVSTGKTVYSHDRITTGPDSKLQILLLDQTAFTLGPDSDMELDEFVYDPATNRGKVAATISKGDFRFVTGKVARRDPSSMKVKVPVGTIGIRGTMTAGSVGPDQATIVLLGPGPENNADEKMGGITVSNDQGSVDVDRDGWGVTIRKGQAPSRAFKLPPGDLGRILAGVASAPKDSKDDGPGGDSEKDSGQRTAAGKEHAADAFAALDAAQDETALFATQNAGLPSGVSTWDEVRGIPGGSGKYVGSAPFYDCTSGSCTGSVLGTESFTLAVDFAAKTLGGNGSSISMTGPGGSGTINQFSYAGLSGSATTDLASHISGAGTFSGTTLKLLNQGGVTAGAATIDIRWSTGVPPTYGGPVTGPLK